MKTINMKAVVTLLGVTVLAGLMACDADTIERTGGKQPDKESLENTYMKIRSTKSPASRAVINLPEGTETVTDFVYCRSTRPVEKMMGIIAKADASFVAVYNDKYGVDLQPMPDANIEIANNGSISINAGERISNKLQITFKANGLQAGTYLLPVVISSAGSTFSDENRVLYYGIVVRGTDLGKYELDTDFINVFYVNTTLYQPLIADMWAIKKSDARFQTIWQRTYGNIVNLRIVQLDYNATIGRTMLKLSTDMQYVLNHTDKYIRPLQDKGRKVCLCLEGGGSGIGFCNLTDAQIADFVMQVKTVIDLYQLDGVNFYDKNSGYGTEGMPTINTTSYPKLIKAMRQALGEDKLVTLTDYEEPTAYFYDTEKTGGIEVGKYIDYAWSGYMSEDEDIQILDPWNKVDLSETDAADLGVVLPFNTHPRKPIAGLLPENYGYFTSPWYGQNSKYILEGQGIMNLYAWKLMGYCPSQIIVWADLISNSQGEYEGSWTMNPANIWAVFPDDGMMNGPNNYDQIVYREIGEYEYLKKDW